MSPRIYADFSSCWEDERGMWCWCLRCGGDPLHESADRLGLYDGMPVVIYYQDDADEFEFNAELGHPPSGRVIGSMWMALFDKTSFRRLR